MKEIDKVAEAKALIQAEEQKKQQDFINEYQALCTKHGMEIVSVPNLSIRAK